MLKKIVPAVAVSKINESELSIQFKNGSLIELRGADNEDSLRGVGLSGLIIDEFASIYDNWSVWNEVLRPALADRHAQDPKQGWCLFIGCVTPETMILSENGIEELGTSDLGYVPENKQVFGINGFDLTTDRYHCGTQKTIKIKTKYGYQIEGTPNHRVLCFDGWKRLDEIDDKSKIYIQAGQGVFGKKEEDLDFCYFLGLYLSEGTMEKNIYRVTISNTDKEIIDFLRDKYGFSCKDGVHSRKNSKEFLERLNRYFEHRTASNKYLTREILSLKRECLVEVLKGYFDGDGHADRNRRRVGCNSSSEKLIRQLHVLLLNFGIISTKTSYITKPTKKVKRECVGHRIEIVGHGSYLFFEKIGFRLTRKNKMRDHSKSSWGYEYWFDKKDFGKLPTKFGYVGKIKRITQKTLSRILAIKPNDKYRLDLVADTVKEIGEGESPVYDFVIPKSQQYFANGFISHNTPKGKDAFFELFMRGKRGENGWTAFQFKTTDNLALNLSSEVENARETMPGNYFRQEFEASFEDYTGLIYPEFSQKLHVIKPVYIPDIYQRIGAIDPAITGTTAALKCAIDENGVMIIYEEYYEQNKRVSEVCETIKDDKVKWYIDPAAVSAKVQREGNLYSLYDEYRDYGVRPEKAENDVASGINRVGEYFKQNKIKIFSTCTNLIWELERYHWAEHKQSMQGDPKPTPYKKDDHACDCLKYLIATRKDATNINRKEEYNPNSAWGRLMIAREKQEGYIYER